MYQPMPTPQDACLKRMTPVPDATDAAIIRAFADIPALLERTPALIARGRWLDCECLIGPVDHPFHASIRAGRIIGNGVHRLRADQKQCDPFYVAQCLCATWNERFKKGATIQRVDLRELEIPLLPLSEQEQLVTALREVEQLARQAAEVVEALAKLVAEHGLDNVERRLGDYIGIGNQQR